MTIENDAAVVKVKNARVTIEIASDFKDQVLKLIEDGSKDLVVGLTPAEFVDSFFLGALVTAVKRASVKNGDLKIVGLQPQSQQKNRKYDTLTTSLFGSY